MTLQRLILSKMLIEKLAILSIIIVSQTWPSRNFLEREKFDVNLFAVPIKFWLSLNQLKKDEWFTLTDEIIDLIGYKCSTIWFFSDKFHSAFPIIIRFRRFVSDKINDLVRDKFVCLVFYKCFSFSKWMNEWIVTGERSEHKKYIKFFHSK